MTRFIPPALLLAATLYLTAPAFTLLGFTLDLNQRDLRVFNNFTDATANDNQSSDVSFPGYFGADMAIWKAAVEWGSLLHGDGSGDPSQPNDLGSGGANFDFTWQGNASGPPSGLNNVLYELQGCSGGVLAATLSDLSGAGWQIFFYSCWNWQDGPDTAWPGGGFNWDIQGIAGHHLGHALGLGHSSIPGSTMGVSSPLDAGKSLRSIEADDAAGVQANYGAASASKPVISDVQIFGPTLRISGSNFGALGNEVWFTQADAGGNGTPIKATGITSTGSSITLTLPSAAGSGDVLVRTAGNMPDALSNAWPLEATACNPPAPSNYCVASMNSTGAAVVLATSGSQSLASDDLVFSGSGMPAVQFGIFISSLSQNATPVGNGVLCVGLPFFRWDLIQANAAGNWSWDPNLAAPPDPSAAIEAGETWNFQLWYRDPAGGGAGFNFSDAAQVGFCD
ncbi:MAG: matrixin family metalloprotease [bacterium]|nr:matrixin family metalloprotease [bacterium]